MICDGLYMLSQQGNYDCHDYHTQIEFSLEQKFAYDFKHLAYVAMVKVFSNYGSQGNDIAFISSEQNSTYNFTTVE